MYTTDDDDDRSKFLIAHSCETKRFGEREEREKLLQNYTFHFATGIFRISHFGSIPVASRLHMEYIISSNRFSKPTIFSPYVRMIDHRVKQWKLNAKNGEDKLSIWLNEQH